MTEYETPLGNLTLDQQGIFTLSLFTLQVIKELHATGSFDWMKRNVDEKEHSIEMQLPYIVKQMKG
jgi:predicted class III extradiol MEMO1 family dioxygenase